MQTPACRKPRITRNSSATSLSDSAEVGSSRMRTRALRQRLGDFHHLLFADRDVLHPVGRLDVGNSQFAEQSRGVGVHAAPIDGAVTGGGLAVEKDVFGNRELGKEIELLM